MVTNMQPSMRHDVSLLTEDDLYLFNEGRHYQVYAKLGAHPHQADGVAGTYFATWAPNAHLVSVVGNFNRWRPGAHPLAARGQSGIWEGLVAGIGKGEIYKFHVESRHRAYRADKADPYGFRHEVPPQSGSVVWDLDYQWGDRAWMTSRRARNSLDAPISIYEVHVGSWRWNVEEDRPLTYRELAGPLADHVIAMGFSHVELMPVMEHPFGGSWGYQVTGYFAPTSRFGTPQDFMYLVDYLHQRGIGVILDWVPSHFPTDEHGLGYYDGTHLYEHADPRQGFHPDWGSWIFNYGRNEVRSFLLSNALFWLDVYHVDGLRIDAVASALYLDYSRKEGEWIPNRFGGRENLDAIAFFQQFNRDVYSAHHDVQTIAEESTSWPGVSRPTHLGGLGFGLKWDMGWMHDTLHYMQRDPIYRVYHHNNLTFRMLYAFTENFVLALSHDEVVHGKGSLLNKMPGDVWQKLANLRLLYGYMYGQPGKKLLFMGGEIGQWSEWSHESSLEWHLLEDPSHRGVADWVADLNRAYRQEPALHELDSDPHGFEWIDANDATGSVISFLRRGRSTDDLILAIANFTPVPREHYRLGVPRGGLWRELLNSDADAYGGGNVGNRGGVQADSIAAHGRPCSVELVLPPLAIVLLKSDASTPAPPVPD
jgi:1,4-alpha-glucan branching enzyme